MLYPKIALGGQRVGLLQFADDLLFFLHINDRTLVNLTQTSQLFEEEACQSINKVKSQLLFSMNTSSGLARLTRDTLQISMSVTSFDYLGIPLALDKTQHTAWHNTLKRIHNRIAGWRGGLLSPAGRRTLIQSVTLAIPVY